MTVNHDVVGSSPTGGVMISLLDVGLAFLFLSPFIVTYMSLFYFLSISYNRFRN